MPHDKFIQPHSAIKPTGFDALPKRFKDYIRHLEEEIYSLRKALPSDDPTSVRIADALAEHHGRDLHYLPDNTAIEFLVGKAWFEVKRADLEVPSLKVTTDFDGLLVIPGVSNVVYLAERRRAYK